MSEATQRRVETLCERLGSLVLTIGIPAHITGYQFLRHGVKMVTDLIRPMMDGDTLIEAMRRLRLSPMPKVIAASALSRDDFVMRAIELGVTFYMVKPFEVDHLLSHIK